MRASKWALVALLLVCAVEGRAQFVAKASGTINFINTSTAYVDLDTTGANFIQVSCGSSHYTVSAGGAYVVTDTLTGSTGLFWHDQTLVVGGTYDGDAQIHWAASNTAGKFGTAHRITMTTPRSTYGGSCQVKAYSGALATGTNGIDAFEQEITGVSGATPQTITGVPSHPGDLIVSAASATFTTSFGLTGGTLTLIGAVPYNGFPAAAGGADLIQTTATSATATWSALGANVSIAMAFFRSAPASSGRRKLTVITGGE